MKYRQEIGRWGADPSPQRQGCFVRLSGAVPLWLLCRGGLEQSPTEECHCPSLSCGLWAASSHKKALCPSPASCSKQMFGQGHPYRVSALPGEEQGRGGYGPDPPSPLRPSPLSFPAGSPASPRTSRSTAEAGRVGVQNPKRTNAALSRSSDSWPTHFTHHMRVLNLIKKAWRIFQSPLFFSSSQHHPPPLLFSQLKRS